MECDNLKIENITEKFLNGHIETYSFPFCMLKKEGDLPAAKITEALRDMGIEKGKLINILCPFAEASRIDLDKCPWYNKPGFK